MEILLKIPFHSLLKLKYLQDLDSNILGKPTSSGNVTTVPEGLMTHLTASGATVAEFAFLSYIMMHDKGKHIQIF